MDMNPQILLCCDLDRTLIPNGLQEESRGARPLFRWLSECPEIRLIYVTGRDREMIAGAIGAYRLPLPDYAIGDVGTTIYRITGTPRNPQFNECEEWRKELSRKWNGWPHDHIAGLFADIDSLRLQEPVKQNTLKVSFYIDPDAILRVLVERVRFRLNRKGIRASIVTSWDETERIGLLDILPEGGTKVDAIRFLIRKKQIPESRVIYAGDSGNDLTGLTSGLRAILVKNAAEEVRREVLSEVAEKGISSRLYLARGGFMGMNGNYSAGVMEGLVHFMPQMEDWLRAACKESEEPDE